MRRRKREQSCERRLGEAATIGAGVAVASALISTGIGAVAGASMMSTVAGTTLAGVGGAGATTLAGASGAGLAMGSIGIVIGSTIVGSLVTQGLANVFGLQDGFDKRGFEADLVYSLPDGIITVMTGGLVKIPKKNWLNKILRRKGKTEIDAKNIDEVGEVLEATEKQSKKIIANTTTVDSPLGIIGASSKIVKLIGKDLEDLIQADAIKNGYKYTAKELKEMTRTMATKMVNNERRIRKEAFRTLEDVSEIRHLITIVDGVFEVKTAMIQVNGGTIIKEELKQYIEGDDGNTTPEGN
ncbi:hypothetical protein ACE193_05720 [Bernardetia sp. OM2101]|uniref:hypothetical protein n=1 Tax=Bernardetia sp. OM2101 TaxID=3344876 RepID=UPI0035D00C7C